MIGMEAPELDVERWLGTDQAPSLSELRGRVVVLEAFQMLCPGCVRHGLPLAQRVHDAFAGRVCVLGLHTVFEHHDAMRTEALAVFLDEYRFTFPVGVDRHDGESAIPVTMQRYGLRGTPSTVVIDALGRIRSHVFGAVDDLLLGGVLGELLAESVTVSSAPLSPPCGPSGCPIP